MDNYVENQSLDIEKFDGLRPFVRRALTFDSSSARRISIMWCLALTAALVSALWIPRGSFVTTMLQDNYFLIQAGHWLAEGLIPHVDFPSPWGIAAYFFPYLGHLFSDDVGSLMPRTFALILVIFLPAIAYVFSSRFRPVFAVPSATYFMLLIAAPVLLGESPTLVTMAMWYNRLGWAFLLLLYLLFIQPQKPTRASKIADMLVASICLIVLFYLKISYAIFAILFVLFISFFKMKSRHFIWSIGVLAFVALVFEMVFHFHGEYSKDLLTAFSARGTNPGGLSMLVKDAVRNFREVGFYLVSMVLIATRKAPRTEQITDLLVFVFVFVSGFMLLAQNSQNFHVPVLLVAVLVSAELEARSFTKTKTETDFWRSLFAAFALAMFIFVPIVHSTSGTLRHAVRLMAIEEGNGEFEALGSIFVEDLYVAEMMHTPAVREAIEAKDFMTLHRYVLSTQFLFQKEYADTILEGAELLRSLREEESTSVMVFDMSNPFPFMVGMRPPRNAPIQLYVGSLFPETDPLPAEGLFRDVDLIMIPKLATSPDTRDLLLGVYGEFIDSYYQEVRTSDHWTVMKRRSNFGDSRG